MGGSSTLPRAAIGRSFVLELIVYLPVRTSAREQQRNHACERQARARTLSREVARANKGM